MSLNNMTSNSGGDNRSLSHKVVSHGTAAYLTLLAAPGIFSLTAPYAVQAFTHFYGEEAAEPALIGHGVLVAILTFFGLERSISLMLTILAVSAARYAWLFGA